MMPRSVTAGQLAGLLGSEPWPAPAYRGLAERIRGLILDGRLSPDLRLPSERSERDLAARLGLSRTTVASAYARLREIGCLAARRGAGHFVVVPPVRASSSYLPGAVRAGEGQLGWNCASSAGPPGLAAAYRRAAERLPAPAGRVGLPPRRPGRPAPNGWPAGTPTAGCRPIRTR